MHNYYESKYYDYIRDFERDYNTRVKNWRGGLLWKDSKGNTKVIHKDAMGVYKRANIDFYNVLKLVNEGKYRGSIQNALRYIREHKKRGLENESS